MSISRTSLGMLAAAGLAAAVPAAQASPNQTLSTATPEQPAKIAASWTGPVTSGMNTSFLLDYGDCSGADPRTVCDRTLVRVVGTVGEGSTVTFRIDGFKPVSDFDIRVYTADETGAQDTYLGSPTSTDAGDQSGLGSDDPRYTSAGDFENKLVDVTPYADLETGAIDQYFLVVVPYFAVLQDSYVGKATLDAKPFVAPTDTE